MSLISHFSFVIRMKDYFCEHFHDEHFAFALLFKYVLGFV